MLGKINLKLIYFIGIQSSWSSVDFNYPSLQQQQQKTKGNNTNQKNLFLKKKNLTKAIENGTFADYQWLCA